MLQDQKDRLQGEENWPQDGQDKLSERQEDRRASRIGCRTRRTGYSVNRIGCRMARISCRKGRKIVELAA
jgi:hypothetical protein